MGKNAWIAVVIMVIVLAFGGWLITNNSQKSNQQVLTPSPTSETTQVSSSPQESSEEAMMKKNIEVMESAMTDKDSLKANLKDVSGGTSTGTAFNLRKDGKLLFTAFGKLPDPPAGSFYMGWIMNNSTKKFEDAGKLDKQKDETYEVSKEFDETYDGYNFIFISQELVDDQKPEKHILGGLAQ